MTKASNVRRCVRHSCGAVPAPGSVARWAIFVCGVALGEARHDDFSRCNAGASVAQAHMWVAVSIEK